MATLDQIPLLPIVDIDDEIEICRDESCKVLGIHAVHERSPASRAGRPPKHCPTCGQVLTVYMQPIKRRVCKGCGYHRP